MTTTTTCPTVGALHARLDVDWADQTVRLILADALQDSGVPELEALADGYRALAVWRKAPDMDGPAEMAAKYRRGWRYLIGSEGHVTPGGNGLHRDWTGGGDKFVPTGLPGLVEWSTRREADDWAARQFAKLSPERRAELLRGPQA